MNCQRLIKGFQGVLLIFRGTSELQEISGQELVSFRDVSRYFKGIRGYKVAEKVSKEFSGAF